VYVSIFPETYGSTHPIHRPKGFKMDIKRESENDQTLTYGIRYPRFTRSTRIGIPGSLT